MQKALVTGGAGFIGSHVVDALVAEGVEVLVVDNFSMGRREHLDTACEQGRVTVVEGDVRSADDMRVVEWFGPDAVFHMAALHFIPYCIKNPQEALDVNVVGLETVVRAVRSAPVHSFVFPSSGATYGFSNEPWDESAPSRPSDIYGISKWLDEQVLGHFHDDRPLVRTVVARLFNAYGPRETNPHVLPEILKRMKRGQELELGNLWPKRDLIYVKDIASALLATASGTAGLEVFNVGTGVGTSIGDVIAAIEEITGEPLKVRQVAERIRADDGHLVSDPAKLKAAGWKPEYDLNAGLRELLKGEGLA